MSKCSICEQEQRIIDNGKVIIGDKIIELPLYNIDLLTFIKGKNICNECMDIYNKIHALENNIDFSCGGTMYFADGRNLD